MKKFWISWYSPKEPFTLHFPWWISGYTWDLEDNEIDIICAAIKAKDEDSAKNLIKKCYDYEQPYLSFRFCSEKEEDWSPWCDRFQKADWMEF